MAPFPFVFVQNAIASLFSRFHLHSAPFLEGIFNHLIREERLPVALKSNQLTISGSRSPMYVSMY